MAIKSVELSRAQVDISKDNAQTSSERQSRVFQIRHQDSGQTVEGTALPTSRRAQKVEDVSDAAVTVALQGNGLPVGNAGSDSPYKKFKVKPTKLEVPDAETAVPVTGQTIPGGGVPTAVDSESVTEIRKKTP